MPTPPDAATLVSALTLNSDADQALFGGCSTASAVGPDLFGAAKETPQVAVPTPPNVATLVSALTPNSDAPDIATLAPASDATNTQTVFLTMPVAATSATEDEAGLPSDGFERSGAVSDETPQFRVHTAPISDAADEAADDSFSLFLEGLWFWFLFWCVLLHHQQLQQ